MNKKGDKTSNMIVGILVAIVAGIIIMSIFRGQSLAASKVVSSYIESLSEDFDGDRINDFYDESPCVAGEDIVIAEKTGKAHYFFADKRTGSCEEITDEYKLKEVEDVSTQQTVCILPDEECGRALKAFYERIRGD